MDEFFNKAKIFLGFEATPTAAEKRRVAIGLPPRQNMIKLNSFKGTKYGEIRVMEPRVYEDSLAVANFLRENIPIIVNLKYLDNTNGKRLIDFVCGTAYAINGHMLKIGENIFLFTPDNIPIIEGDTQQDDTQEETKAISFVKSNAA